MALPHLESVGAAASLSQTLINYGEQTGLDGIAELALRITIGISVYPDDATDPENLLQYAETALVAVKAQSPARLRLPFLHRIDA